MKAASEMVTMTMMVTRARIVESLLTRASTVVAMIAVRMGETKM